MFKCASGAQNAFAFASAVKSGRMPDVATLTYQGIFNEHDFYAGEPAKTLMETSSLPVLQVDGKPWLAIYLKSFLDGRPRDDTPIDLSVVIDISGSMRSTMSYNEVENGTTRLDCAKMAVGWLVKEVLRGDDRIALSTFNTAGQQIHGLTDVGKMDVQMWLQECETLATRGGTTLSAGMQVGREVFGTLPDDNHIRKRARRILFLTDMAEMGATELGDQISKYAAEGVFVSIVGMGVEFNASLTDTVTKNKGSIYSSATNVKELRQAIVEEFDFNFFPAAFDVHLSIRSGDLDVEAVYGTPFDQKARTDTALNWNEESHGLYDPGTRAAAVALLAGSGDSKVALPPDCVSKVIGKLEPPRQSVTEVNTFFPCPVTEGCIKGGLVLVQLASKPGAGPVPGCSLELTLEYTAVSGEVLSHTELISFAEPYERGSFAGHDARTVHALEKGLLLQEYCAVCREHMALANQASREELGDAEEVCARLERRLGEVKAVLGDLRFQPRDTAVAAQLCARADDFVGSFRKAVGAGAHSAEGKSNPHPASSPSSSEFGMDATPFL